jgi:hypothetical protein
MRSSALSVTRRLLADDWEEAVIDKIRGDGSAETLRFFILSTHVVTTNICMLMRPYFGGAIVPHSLHFLRFSSAIHALTYVVSWVPKSTK